MRRRWTISTHLLLFNLDPPKCSRFHTFILEMLTKLSAVPPHGSAPDMFEQIETISSATNDISNSVTDCVHRQWALK